MEGNGKQSIEELLKILIAEQEKTRIEIRTELATTNAKLDQTNAKLDQTNAKLDQTREEIAAVGGRVEGVRMEVVALRAMSRADDRETQELRGRVERIEPHLQLSR